MKRLLIAVLIFLAVTNNAPAASAEPDGGAFHVECSYLFPESEGGQAVLTPLGGVNHSCRYEGPAEGGGADTTAFGSCVQTPAGNINCNLR